MKLGLIGLGKMGSRIAEKLLSDGHELVVWNRSPQPVEELKTQNAKRKTTTQNLKSAENIEAFVKSLDAPRVVWLMLPAGEATQAILDEVEKYVEKDDIVIDGGNANYKDTQRRFENFAKNGIRFLGIGVSGGIIAVENGYPLMAGGDRIAYEHILPILKSLAKPQGGYEYFGTGGAGHFVKMVHNAIEYSYMQGIGEGFGVLEKSPYSLDLEKVAQLYRKGTLISGFMMDRTAEALSEDPRLEKISGIIGSASGETIWTIDAAKAENVSLENIIQAKEFRDRSQTDSDIQSSFAARMVAALRNKFGGHEIKKK